MSERLADLGLGTVRILPPDLPPAARIGQDYGPPAGFAALREALALAEGVAADGIALTAGASMALTALLAGLPRPCSILCPRPYFPAYIGTARLLGLEVVFYDLGACGDRKLDVASLVGAVRPDTRAVLINCPGNPAGNILDPDSLQALAEMAEERDLLVVSDEVYADFTYEEPMPDLRDACGPDRTVRVRSFSKAHGIPGERLGYVVGPSRVVERVAAAHWSLAMSPPATAQMMALSMLGRDHGGRLAELRRSLDATRSAVAVLLAHRRHLRYRMPQAGIFYWIEVIDRARGSADLASDLASHAGVVVVPGERFGISDRTFLRASFALPQAEAVDGFTRLADYIEGAAHG